MLRKIGTATIFSEENQKIKKWSLSLFSAILLILSFPNFNLNYLAYIGFVPLFFAIEKKSPKKTFLIFYVCGFLFYLGTLYWLYRVTVVGLVALCLYLALYFGVFGYVIRSLSFLRKQESKNMDSRFRGNDILILIPSIWALLEYLQSHLFTGFGWALLGYSQYKNLPFIQIADFSGVYGVSFVIMMVNVALFRLLKKSFKEIIIVGVILFAVVVYGIIKVNEPGQASTIKVSVIQGNIPQNLKWDPDVTELILEKYSALTKKAALHSPDLIIWPETAFPGFLITDRRLTRQVLDLVREIKTPLLLGANTEEGLKTFNSAVLISAKGEIIDKYDKIHLVPFGEYVPFSDRFPVLHNLVLGELGEFTAGKEFKVFTYPDKFASLICYEDIFPQLAKKFVQNGAGFLVIITNDAWYGKTGAPYQHAACSVFRAIENRVPIVRCANTGYSCFIDKKGKIYDAVEEDGIHLFISGYKTAEVVY